MAWRSDVPSLSSLVPPAGPRKRLKRTELKRKSALKRRYKRHVRTSEEAAWKVPHAGFCQCGCGRFSMHLHRHHILLAQTVRKGGGSVYALANSMLLHPDCHAAHHSGFRKISMDRVPAEAIDFAVRLLGEGKASAYFAARYAPARERRTA